MFDIGSGGRAFILLGIMGFVSGCATTSAGPEDNDPLESINRSILEFNFKSDRLVLKPAAEVYTNIVPKPVRTGVGNFFSNLWEPMTIVNDLLQGKFIFAAEDASRFLINTFVGVLGIFDVAEKAGLPRRSEDFGQTLAVWGVPPGPYIVLPFLGPSNLRDTAGLIPQFLGADAVSHLDDPEIYYAAGLRLVDTRSGLLGADSVLDAQPDKYLFLREAYRQRRNSLIHDADPARADDDPSQDALIDQLLQEE